MIGSPVEEIKARLDLVDFIREYVPLKKMGGNWKGVCPFHTEKTPSFMVSSEKGIWKCFGCGAGGDLFAFLMKKEGMEFPEALRTLAQRAGVMLRAQDPKLQNQRSRMLELLAVVSDFFQAQLKQSAAAESARQYLSEERRLTAATIAAFSVGFAPHSWNDLSHHLLDRGFSESEILASGVVVPSEKPGRDQRALPFYDRFRGRITFPITDTHGSVIGFGARTFVKDSEEPKYINTPATALYDKSRVLFGLPMAKRAIQEAKQAILLEGYMDVLASHQAGVQHVLAPCGTAFTAEQVTLLLRYASDIVFCFDGDDAGRIAEERAADVAWGTGARLFSLSPLPNGVKDVDELVRADSSLWQEHAKNPVPFFSAYEKRVAAALPVGDIAAKQDGLKRLTDRLAHCVSAVEQEHWRSYLAQRWQVSEGAIRELLITAKRSVVPARQSGNPAPAGSVMPVQDMRTRIAERILALLLRHPDGARDIFEHLDAIWLPETLRALFQLTMAGSARERPEHGEQLQRIELLGESLYHDIDPDAIRDEAEDLVRRSHELYLRAELGRISIELRAMEGAGSISGSQSIFDRFNVVTDELTKLSL